MFNKIKEIISIYELRKKLLITFALLVVYRIGTHVPVPGINSEALALFFSRQSGNLLGFFDMFTGGALSRLTVFGLGIMPYISAAIILELLTVVSPKLMELKKQGTEGRQKITNYTPLLSNWTSKVMSAKSWMPPDSSLTASTGSTR